MSVKVTISNKANPEGKIVVEHPNATSAGAFLGGAIQAAIDAGGILIIEVEEA